MSDAIGKLIKSLRNVPTVPPRHVPEQECVKNLAINGLLESSDDDARLRLGCFMVYIFCG